MCIRDRTPHRLVPELRRPAGGAGRPRRLGAAAPGRAAPAAHPARDPERDRAGQDQPGRRRRDPGQHPAAVPAPARDPVPDAPAARLVTARSTRAVTRPKIALLDTGLAASLVNVSPAGAGPAGDPQYAGRLLEAFVAAELRKQLGWSEEAATMYHFRDRNGPSVDLVLQTPDGRVAALQVKA